MARWQWSINLTRIIAQFSPLVVKLANAVDYGVGA